MTIKNAKLSVINMLISSLYLKTSRLVYLHILVPKFFGKFNEACASVNHRLHKQFTTKTCILQATKMDYRRVDK